MRELTVVGQGFLERATTRTERAVIVVGIGYVLGHVLMPPAPKPQPPAVCGPAGPYATSGPFAEGSR